MVRETGLCFRCTSSECVNYNSQYNYKVLFYQTRSTFPNVDYTVRGKVLSETVAENRIVHFRGAMTFELIAGILRNNSDRGTWDRMKYFHIICYSWLRHSANFESTLSMELNSSLL